MGPACKHCAMMAIFLAVKASLGVYHRSSYGIASARLYAQVVKYSCRHSLIQVSEKKCVCRCDIVGHVDDMPPSSHCP